MRGYSTFDQGSEETTRQIAHEGIKTATAWIVATDDGSDDICVNVAGDMEQLAELLAAITRQLDKILKRFEAESGGECVQ